VYLAKHAASAKLLLGFYRPPQPMHLYLNAHFKQHKKFGSRDRKTIADMVFAIMRLRLPADASEQDIIAAYEILQQAKTCYTLSNERQIAFNKDVFETLPQSPALNLPLSKGIEADVFYKKLLVKPFTFLRVRRPFKVPAELQFAKFGTSTMALLADVKLDQQGLAEVDYVVQDANSQMVSAQIAIQAKNHVWDVCAASGGKSLAMLDAQRHIHLIASDVRPQMMATYKRRLAGYGFVASSTFTADIARDINLPLAPKSVDVLVCDVPCSGSGTWSRTPEQYYFADLSQLQQFSELQFSIVQNALRYAKQDAMLYYITCSVFAHENEAVVERLVAQCNVELVQQQTYDAMTHNCDWMFCAVLCVL
jgi:16S rRNA (cytosine967-C5)-methyltransferase